MDDKNEVKKVNKSLEKFGLSDKDVDKLPNSLSEGWSIHEEQLPDGNFLVEYRRNEGDSFPVSFTAKSAKHAKALLLLWIKENNKA